MSPVRSCVPEPLLGLGTGPGGGEAAGGVHVSGWHRGPRWDRLGFALSYPTEGPPTLPCEAGSVGLPDGSETGQVPTPCQA